MVMVICKVQMALADLQDFVYQAGIFLKVFILSLSQNIFGKDRDWCISSSCNRNGYVSSIGSRVALNCR